MVGLEFSYDIAVVGGGLHGSLAAWALASPDLVLIEAGPTLCGNRTWCCHAGDLGTAYSFLKPLFLHSWPAYEVSFPGWNRRVNLEYLALPSNHLSRIVAHHLQQMQCTLLLGTEVCEVQPASVTLNDGRVFNANFVVDTRNQLTSTKQGWQKFVGWEVELARPHQRDIPMLMDASVDQYDGFRFMYVLPFSPTRMLLEDTYYCSDPKLDFAGIRSRLAEYCEARKWKIDEVVREESGVLPVPFNTRCQPTAHLPLRLGVGGGWFHPTTGYSLGCGAETIQALAKLPREQAVEEITRLAARHRRQAPFARFLNRLMFGAFSNGTRRSVLDHFYRVLSEPAIGRFYALRSTWSDRARLLSGKPPHGFSISRLLLGTGH
jgi:lycopene beta-cyclase